MNLPMFGASDAPLLLENIPALQDEVRALAQERGAVILAHNYQLPEIQDVADYVGDSLGLSQQAAKADAEMIVFCGVHFMAETASILCPDKTVLIPDLDAGCSLADSITASQLRDWKAAHPGAIVVMYVNTTAEVKAQTDYCCTSANAVKVVQHIYAEHGEDTEILFGPDMFLGAYVEKSLGRAMHVWDGECHVHAGIKPDDIAAVRAAHPGADFLIHPECGCSTSVMEYVAAGDIDSDGVHMLSTGGMLGYARGIDGPARPDGDRRHRDGHAVSAPRGGAGRRVHRCQRGGPLPLHEDDHAPEAPRRAARRRARGQGAGGDRRSRAAPDRADGGDQLIGAIRSIPLVDRVPDARERDPLSLELVGRVAVDVRGCAHLEAVPQRAGVVHALEPRHALERVRDQDHDELGAALALRRRALLVRDPGASEHRDVDRPSVIDARQVPLQLAPVDGGGHLHGAIVPIPGGGRNGSGSGQYLAIAGTI